MENLEELESLEELYLSHNGLTKLEGLEKNVSAKYRNSLTGTNPYFNVAQTENIGYRWQPNQQD